MASHQLLLFALQQDSVPALQPVLFGSAAILAAILVCFFPETRGRKLPETPEEWIRWRRGELDLNRSADKHQDNVKDFSVDVNLGSISNHHCETPEGVNYSITKI